MKNGQNGKNMFRHFSTLCMKKLRQQSNINWCRSCVFIVNFEQAPHINQVFSYNFEYVFANLYPTMPEDYVAGGILQKGYSRRYTKFTGEHLCWSLFLKKIARCTTSTLLKANSS